MSTQISGVEPELTRLNNFNAVMTYMHNKGKEERLDPEQYNIKTLKKLIVHYHNKYRAHHNSPALSIDSVLNSHAQNWADEMAHRKQCLIHEHPSKYGENLLTFGSSHFPSPHICAAAIIQGLYQEGFGYDYTRFNPGSLSQVGHFTQLIWKSSRKLGVGVTIVKRDSMHHLYVCLKYDPPGNMQSSDEYLSNVKAPKGKQCCTIL